jgi:hypothetical protein
MRYSIAALSLVSPALALPTLPFLDGGLFGENGLLGDLFSHGHSQGSSYTEAPAYNDGPASYGSGPASYGSGPASYGSGPASYGSGPASYGSGPASYGSGPNSANTRPSGYGSGSVADAQESMYNIAASQGTSVSSSVVAAASAGPQGTGTPLSGSGVASSNLTLTYMMTTTTSSTPTADASAPAAPSGETSASFSGQTCESPDIIGCQTASNSSATEVVPESSGVYDFIIVGGGTAGLVIANRLSENSDTSVAVIEAGDLVFDNKNVTNVDGYGLSFGTGIDWQYESAPQAYAGNKTQTLRAGKALGGTSTINGESIFAYTQHSL